MIFSPAKKSNKHSDLFNKNSAGFTYIEILVVIIIILVLGAVVLTDFLLQKRKLDLKENMQELKTVLLLAQSKTLASSSSSQYGVYLDAVSSPNAYVVFKGASYASRTVSYDITHQLPSSIEFSAISLGGGKEIVFDKITGSTSQSGNFSLRLKTDTSQTQTLYVSSSGVVSSSNPAIPSDSSRVTDSRHVHFDYSRANFVNCPSTDATLSLYFDGAASAQQTISVCNNLVNNLLDWKGTVTVGGVGQYLEIHTHHLQDGSYANGTQFSIHRDGSQNTKSLKITISEDAEYIINYSADGLTTTHTSTYVSNFAWQ